jgi:hypothetical protein
LGRKFAGTGQQGNEAAIDWQNLLLENPAEFDRKLGEYINSTVGERVDTVANEYITDAEVKNKFMASNSDYEDVTNSQEFQQFQSQHPEYGPATAYAFYKLAEANQQLEAAKQAGIQEGEQNTINNLKAKQGIKILTGQGSPVNAPSNPDVSKMSHQERVQHATNMIMSNRNQP